MSPAPLDLSPDDFAALAARVGEEAVRHLRGLDSAPIRPSTTGPESLDLFAGPAPEHGMGPAALDALGEVARHSRAGNGRFFGYVMGSGRAGGRAGRLLRLGHQPERDRLALRARRPR